MLELNNNLRFRFSKLGYQVPMISTQTGLFCFFPTMAAGKRHGIVREPNTLPSDRTVMGHFVASSRQELLFLVERVGTQGLPAPISPNEFENDWLHHIRPLTKVPFFIQDGELAQPPVAGKKRTCIGHVGNDKRRALTAQTRSKTRAQRTRNPVVRRDIYEECGHQPGNHCGRVAGAGMELAIKRQIWHGACMCASMADATSPNGPERPRRPPKAEMNDEVMT